MKYNIIINQKAIIEHRLPLNLMDACILAFINDYVASNHCQKMLDKGRVYFLLFPRLITEQMPMLDLKPDSAYRRIRGLVEKGFLDQHELNQSAKQPWYAVTDKTSLLNFENTKSELSENNPNHRISIPSEPSDFHTQNIGFPSDNNNINNNTISGGEKSRTHVHAHTYTHEESVVVPMSATVTATPTTSVTPQTPETAQLISKIEETRKTFAGSSVMREQQLMKLRISPEYYNLLTQAFFDEQVALADTGDPVDWKNLRRHALNWIRTQVDLGTQSAYHPDYKPQPPSQTRSPSGGYQNRQQPSTGPQPVRALDFGDYEYTGS